MANFEQAIKTILEHEGGYVNHANDPGGATNYGVSLRFLKATGQLQDYDFDNDGDIDADDIKCMNVDDACDIYRTHWWDKYNYSRIDDQAIATKLFDMAVNMGQKQAVKLVQRACMQLIDSGLVADGIMGPMTVNTINSLNSDELLKVTREQQADFYKSLIKNNPKLSAFQNGWMKRAYA